ncbi:hypothetical protein ACTJJ7_15380 [Phyllobacterium sp. 22229]|uniref:hypothetical protein n=1 Tax=Phyllobacterium sp. 22229 TaxID=3453895 RepID=UPI003F83C2D9
MTHSQLIARLEQLTAPDREVDILIGKIFPPKKIHSDGSWFERDDFVRYPAVTASVDAALALASRVLPGWLVANIGQDDSKTWHAEIRKGHCTAYSSVELGGAPVPAIALCIAILKAHGGQ